MPFLPLNLVILTVYVISRASQLSYNYKGEIKTTVEILGLTTLSGETLTNYLYPDVLAYSKGYNKIP